MSKELRGAVPFDEGMADMYRKNPEMAAGMLNQCLEDGDAEMLLVTLRQIAKAFGGVSHVAEMAGVSETSLYRTLSRNGNPNLKTLMSISNVIGMRLAFVPKTPSSARP